jgi:hypothetical protein
MAASGERRMVFDIRGRRKHVVRVVYAILALLMGASLFLVVGPVNLGGLLGGSSSSSASAALDEQAQAIERKLRREPNSEALLAALVRTRYSAGNTLVEVNPETGQQTPTPEAGVEYQKAVEVWSRYLAQKPPKPSSNTAILAANAYVSLYPTSISTAEAQENAEGAAAAQKIVAEAKPSVGAYTTLALYSYAGLDFAAAAAAGKKAEALATTKAERKKVQSYLGSIEKRAKKLEKQQKELAKSQKGQGKEQLQNPFGGLGTTP